MRIGIDIMGGDYAPQKTVHGAILALNELPKDITVVLFGKENQILSEKRAFAVYKYLIENKINDYRLDYQGFGEIKPLSNNNNELGRMINRRTSFKIIH